MSPKLLNILLVLIPVALYFAYIDPMYSGQPGLIWTPDDSIVSLQSKNKQYDNALQQVPLVISEIEKLNKDYLAISDEARAKALMLLPDRIDPVKLRNEVTSIGNKSNIAITGLSVAVDGRDDYKELGSYAVSFSVKSRYPAFKKFLENYEKSMRLFIPESIIIQKTDKKQDGAPLDSTEDLDALNIRIVSRVYYIK
jgi:hypothetical protein